MSFIHSFANFADLSFWYLRSALKFLTDLPNVSLQCSHWQELNFWHRLCYSPLLPSLIIIGTLDEYPSLFCQFCWAIILDFSDHYITHLFWQHHGLERLNSGCACEICQPYRPLHGIFIQNIRIVHIINNLHILRPYLPLTLSAQNPDEDVLWYAVFVFVCLYPALQSWTGNAI